MRHILLHSKLGLMPLHLQHELSGQYGVRGPPSAKMLTYTQCCSSLDTCERDAFLKVRTTEPLAWECGFNSVDKRSLFSHHIFPEKSFFHEWIWSDLKRDCGHMIQKIIPLPWFSASIGGHIFSISIRNSSSPKAWMRGSSTPYWDDFMEQKFLI